MELQPTGDQQLFQETAARFIKDTCPLAVVRELADDEAGFDKDWWQQAADLGWLSIMAPEELGGGAISEEGLRDLGLVAFERGRRVSPGPFVPTNAAIAVLAEMANRPRDVDQLLTHLMAGDSIAAVAIEESAVAWGPSNIETSAVRVGSDLVINGVKSPVEAAAQADVHLVAAQGDDDPLLVIVPAGTEGLTIRPRRNVDLVRRFGSVHLDDVTVPLSSVVATGKLAVDRCLDVATVLQLAETVGVLDRVFELTIEWSFDRHTFGRPLASYQELKHRFADMKLWLEASKATVISALSAVSRHSPDASELVSCAKSYVSEHAPELVQDCVQIHGGIGVTWDHDIHLYLRRVTLNCSTYGTVRDHRERLAEIAMDGV